MNALTELIRAEIKSGGAMTFAKFMELALYHPQWGYYMSDSVKIGSEGDFYTAPTATPLFGAMIARQIHQMWQNSGCPEQWSIVECGPGNGQLAWDIMEALRREQPDLYKLLDYYLVEISAELIRTQQNRLAASTAAAKYRWSNSLTELNSIEGCILANELVDAFPVHLVQQRAQGLQELYVTLEEKEAGQYFRLCPGALSTNQLAEFFQLQNVCLAENQKAEVNLKARQWLGEGVACLKKGYLLLIDYGAAKEELYAPKRFNGTLRCFYQHQLVENPLLNVGKQDITAHVNFSMLALWGEQLGLKARNLLEQPQFLLNMGVLDFLQKQPDYGQNSQTQQIVSSVKKLLLPGGMGSIFKVLIFDKLS